MRAGAEPRIDLYLAPTRTWDEAGLAGFSSLLEPAEQARAASFGNAGARLDFIVAHGLTRLALSRVRPDVPAPAWRLRSGPLGKPEADGPGAPWFSLSHAGGRAVVAVSCDHPLGVDGEPVDAALATDGTAATFCAPAELEALRRLDPPARVEAFFALWTLKESLLKAAGRGLGTASHAVVCGLAPLRVVRLASDLHGPWQSWTAPTDDRFRIGLSIQGARGSTRTAAYAVHGPGDFAPGCTPEPWPLTFTPVPHGAGAAPGAAV